MTMTRISNNTEIAKFPPLAKTTQEEEWKNNDSM